MPIISKETAQRHLDMWLEAEAAVSTGQSYQIEQMMLTRASLKQIRESIIFWEKKVAEAEAAERGRAGTGSITSPRMMCKDGGLHGKYSGQGHCDNQP